jgi:phage tail sheath protein FI
MPTVFQHPGVYMTEVPPSSRPIEGVATSVAAFVGRTPMGPSNHPTRVTSWTEFVRNFGDPNPKIGPFLDGSYMAHAVRGYFLNGGTTCWIVRVDEAPLGHVPKALLPSATKDAPGEFAFVRLRGLPESMTVKVTVEEETPKDPKADPAPEPTVKITVTAEDPEDPTFVSPQSDPEIFTGLSSVRGPKSKYLVDVINAAGMGSKFVSAVEIDPAAKLPRVLPAAGEYPLALVADETMPEPTAIAGDSSTRSGMTGLEIASEVTMVCLPDLIPLVGKNDDGTISNEGMDEMRNVQGALVAACSEGGRMAILDPPPGLKPQAVADWRNDAAMPNNPYATLYWPWIEVMHPVTGDKFTMPPCGHVAGVWARTDNTRGVHKAPANEELAGTVGLDYLAADGDSDLLNPAGINVIRGFTGRGTRIWGARTLSVHTAPEWKYINVRRLFNYVETSILNGTSWAVFEPNDALLWGQLRVSVTNFLTGVWRSGALFGTTPDDAFFVKCDADTNPQDLIDGGQVNIQIGIAPVKPAEFVVFQISQYAATAA